MQESQASPPRQYLASHLPTANWHIQKPHILVAVLQPAVPIPVDAPVGLAGQSKPRTHTVYEPPPRQAPHLESLRRLCSRVERGRPQVTTRGEVAFVVRALKPTVHKVVETVTVCSCHIHLTKPNVIGGCALGKFQFGTCLRSYLTSLRVPTIEIIDRLD